jgi:hypothetical protein
MLGEVAFVRVFIWKGRGIGRMQKMTTYDDDKTKQAMRSFLPVGGLMKKLHP